MNLIAFHKVKRHTTLCFEINLRQLLKNLCFEICLWFRELNQLLYKLLLKLVTCLRLIYSPYIVVLWEQYLFESCLIWLILSSLEFLFFLDRVQLGWKLSIKGRAPLLLLWLWYDQLRNSILWGGKGTLYWFWWKECYVWWIATIWDEYASFKPHWQEYYC